MLKANWANAEVTESLHGRTRTVLISSLARSHFSRKANSPFLGPFGQAGVNEMITSQFRIGQLVADLRKGADDEEIREKYRSGSGHSGKDQRCPGPERTIA